MNDRTDNYQQMHRGSIGHGEEPAWQIEHGRIITSDDDTDEVTRRERGEIHCYIQATTGSSCMNRASTAVRYRPFHRYITALTLLLLSTTIIYIQFSRSRSSDMIPTHNTEIMGDTTEDGIYGTQATPDFTDTIKVQDLEAQYVPNTGKDRRPSRLIIVGDVHGMKNELMALLDKVSFKKSQDHLILVGDLITKGYDSLGVIDLAISLGASAVRGNHEDRVLLAHDELHAKHIASPGPFEDPTAMEDDDDDMEEVSWNHGNYEDHRLAKSLSKTQLTWLKNLPVILRVGDIEGMGEVVVVHAGLVAGIPLEAQDTFHAMNMRTIDMHSHVPSEARDGDSWTKLWNRHQQHLPKNQQRTTVVYGHDSKRGLRIEEFTKGVDTGCRKGGELTALVIEGGRDAVEQRIVQYHCEKTGVGEV